MLAYGPTGSGKTHTMMGTQTEPGFAPRALAALFAHAKEDEAVYTYTDTEKVPKGPTPPAESDVGRHRGCRRRHRRQIHVGLLEIYNETVRDLLAATDHHNHHPGTDRPEGDKGRKTGGLSSVIGSSSSGDPYSNPNLNLSHLGPGQVSCVAERYPGLQWREATSATEATELLQRGLAARSWGETEMNDRSSRSHVMLIARVAALGVDTDRDTNTHHTGAGGGGAATRTKRTTSTSSKGQPGGGRGGEGNLSQGEGSEVVRESALWLVDLAGSERVSRSGATGATLRETQYINKSLSSLADVFEALQQRRDHVPFRNSKLTLALAYALTSHAKVAIVAHVAPEEASVSETLSTLQFAQRS